EVSVLSWTEHNFYHGYRFSSRWYGVSGHFRDGWDFFGCSKRSEVIQLTPSPPTNYVMGEAGTAWLVQAYVVGALRSGCIELSLASQGGVPWTHSSKLEFWT